ncbi:glycosyltransferase, partial [Glutamicibacter arilaitensis]|uniref:glycosyltransferase n=1 Tax=Glutamicibacter arilaitensis TaxID=256701 RepID=UPI003FD19AA5
MKIVVVAPREEHWDGTGGAIATWVQNVQVPSNHNLTVVGASKNNGNDWYFSPRRLQFAKVAISRTAALWSPFLRVKSKKLENLMWLKGLLYVFLLLPEVRNADVVYIHNRPLYGKFLRILGFSGKIILHMHNHATPYFRHMTAENLQRIDRFLFCSEYIRHAAVNECSLPEERTAVLYNGVAENQVRRVSPMSLELLFVGRLQEIKGADVAIQTVSILRENGYDATLKLIGGSESGLHDSLTPFSSTLKQMAETVNAKFGCNVITFLGPK